VRRANVTIIATLRPPYDLDMKSVPLSISGGGNAYINCTGGGFSFQGVTTAIWQPIGNSISYPYDIYGMTFEVLVYLSEHRFRINETASKITFYGLEKTTLENVWRIGEKYLLEKSALGITMTFSRIESWSILIQVAVISMYLLFAGSFFLNLSDIRSRLTVYFTIAAFSLSFIIYLQPNLPWRPFYTLPEFLIIALMAVVAIAALFSMIGAGRFTGYLELLPDIFTLIIFLVFWGYLFFIFTQGTLTSMATNLLTQVYVSANVFAYLGIFVRLFMYWIREKRRKEEGIKPVPYEF